jgi:uncharacterized YccA/Bax inhibitor family protein
MTSNRCQSLARSRWFMLAFCVCLGGFVVLAGWLGGQLVAGLIAFAVLGGFGLLISLASGSETVRGLRGDGRDERFALIDLRATAVTGQVLIVAVIVGWLVEIARGHSGNPYQWLGALGGLAYLLAVAFFRWRG